MKLFVGTFTPEVVFVLLVSSFVFGCWLFCVEFSLRTGLLGFISVLLALVGCLNLSLDFPALLLFSGGLGLMVLDLVVATYGFLSLVGLGFFVFGSFQLFPAAPLPGWLVGLAATAVALYVLFLAVFCAERLPSLGGENRQLVGARGKVVEKLEPEGVVVLQGEYWQAEAEQEVPSGEEVEVQSVSNETIYVKPVSST